jgi:hypothetical protein
MGRSFGWDQKNRGPVSQQVWHDKDPSLLKSPKRRAKLGLNFAAFHRQWWHLHIKVKYSWAVRKTVNKQAINWSWNLNDLLPCLLITILVKNGQWIYYLMLFWGISYQCWVFLCVCVLFFVVFWKNLISS